MEQSSDLQTRRTKQLPPGGVLGSHLDVVYITSLLPLQRTGRISNVNLPFALLMMPQKPDYNSAIDIYKQLDWDTVVLKMNSYRSCFSDHSRRKGLEWPAMKSNQCNDELELCCRFWTKSLLAVGLKTIRKSLDSTSALLFHLIILASHVFHVGLAPRKMFRLR